MSRKGIPNVRTRVLEEDAGSAIASSCEVGQTVRLLASTYGVDEMTSKVEVGPDCWLWTGFKLRGYGQFWRHGRNQRAHRVAWEFGHGHPVPDDLTIDHLCRNPSCVRPEHLEAVPAGVNTRRGDTASSRNTAKVRCDAGHDLSGPNLYVTPDGRRQCRACRRLSCQRYKARKVAF